MILSILHKEMELEFNLPQTFRSKVKTSQEKLYIQLFCKCTLIFNTTTSLRYGSVMLLYV
jgi:hypothetical protein